ncbi:MAG: glycosyltransferase, partial [Candidatus Dadabacteria bacterium]
FKPDIVHTHAAKSGALGRLAASNHQVPAIVHTYHGHVFHSYFNSFSTKFFVKTERFLGRKTHAIIAISEAQKKELAYEFRIAPPHKFRVIPLGFNLDKFQTDQEIKRKQFRTEFNIAEDEIIIGIIGRLVPVKNHILFIKALAHVLQNTKKKVKAFIVGGGETRPSLEEAASQAGIPFSTEKDISFFTPLVFTSWRSDIDVINAGLDIVALTSFNEGTPVSLIEAQAANKPIVSTRVGGISDIVHENETALLADVNDQALFSDHLLRLVQDDDLRYQLGKNSSKYVMERFSYQRLVTDTAALYNELLSETTTAHAVLR